MSRHRKNSIDTGAVLLEGYFQKMGISNTNSWKKRYFRLRQDPLGRNNLHLAYYEKEKSKKPKGTIVIGIGSGIRHKIVTGRTHCFELCAEGNIKLISCAPSRIDCQKWIDTISGTIAGWADEVLTYVLLPPSTSILPRHVTS